jgi:glucose/arabinose dehydrogenase
LFGLVTLVKSDNCYFASLINFSKSKEVFRAPCLPDADLLDLNGVGGGFAELNGSLLLALGAPEHSSTKIANLAQDKVSPYGKILIFTAQDLYYKPDSNMKYSTYALGVRNPEGMVNLDGDVYSVEHGPKGGDELNFIEKDGNYGWPKYSLGSKYSGEPYTITGDVKFYKMPIYSFTPSAAISDVIACPASLKKRYFPLQCLLIASLRGRSIFIALIEKTTRKLIQIERLEIGMRVREFSRDSSEKLYFTTDGLGVFQLEFNNIGDQPKN